MTGPVPVSVMIPPFIAIDRCEAVSSAMLNTTDAVRPVVEMNTGSSSSATATSPVASA